MVFNYESGPRLKAGVEIGEFAGVPKDLNVGAVFVTSSGTGTGKTLVTAALVHQLRTRDRAVRAIKPVESGWSDSGVAETDSGVLLAALGRASTQEAAAAITPWRFAAPLSPDMAAAREGREIDFDSLVGFCRREIAAAGAETLLIEGVGGVRVPLTGIETVAEWIAALGCPAILVVGSYLGAISHALTAAETLAARGIGIASVVVSESAESPAPLEETADTIARFLGAVRIVTLPRIDGPSPWRDAPDLTSALGQDLS